MIKLLEKKHLPQIKKLLHISLSTFYPGQSPEWFISQLEPIDFNLAVGYFKEDVLIGLAILKEEDEPLGKIEGKGVRGDAMAIHPSHQKQGIGTELVEFIKNTFQDYDYCWGTQSVHLPNEEFWSKFSEVYHTDENRRYSYCGLK